MVQGHAENIYFDDSTLSKHVLFLGGIGTGKTNAMKQLVQTLRREAGPDDVFVVFDTKGDFLEDFYRTGTPFCRAGRRTSRAASPGISSAICSVRTRRSGATRSTK